MKDKNIIILILSAFILYILGLMAKSNLFGYNSIGEQNGLRFYSSGLYIIIPFIILIVIFFKINRTNLLGLLSIYFKAVYYFKKIQLYQFKAFFLCLYLLLLSYLLFVNTPHNGRGSSHWQFIYGNKAHYSLFEKMGWSINSNILIIILLSVALFLYLLYKLIEVLIEKK